MVLVMFDISFPVPYWFMQSLIFCVESWNDIPMRWMPAKKTLAKMVGFETLPVSETAKPRLLSLDPTQLGFWGAFSAWLRFSNPASYPEHQ